MLLKRRLKKVQFFNLKHSKMENKSPATTIAYWLPATLEKVKKLAEAQGLQYTTFLARLLKEDIDRLWNVFDKAV